MGNHRTPIRLALLLLAIAVPVFLFLSCGGGNGSSDQKGAVALYVTDGMADFQQVTATITRVQARNTGTGTSCDILTDPVTMNISELSSVLQLVGIAECPAADYNRLHIEFEQDVQLMDGQGVPSACSFTSYKDNGNGPNVLACDPASGICSLDINGGVNVLVNRTTPVALDFDLKDFDVRNFGDPETCAVTMKVSPIHADGIRQCGHRRAVTGRITSLNTDAGSFLLWKGNRTFSVDYSGVSGTVQPGVDVLLQRAQDDGLKVQVIANDIDLGSSSITAQALAVKTEGVVSGLDTTARIFTLTYRQGKQMTVYYEPPARTEGVIGENAWVEVKLYGYDDTDDRYLAIKVEREYDENHHGKISEN